MILIEKKKAIIAFTIILAFFIITQISVYVIGVEQNKLNRSYEQDMMVEHVEEEELVSLGVSDDEVELLEKIVMAEANGEPFEGKVAVVNVILNRVNSPWYPDTIEEVIFQRGQFNPTWDGSLERINRIKGSVSEAVYEALTGYNAIPDDTLFFLNEDIATDFTIPNTRTFVEKIGNHSFYK